MIAFVTNFCAHYRRGVFKRLAEKIRVTYLFYSAGKEWYWQEEHGIYKGQFESKYLPGFQIGSTRISLVLPFMLFNPKYKAIIKCINGKFALPSTYLAARLTGKPFILWTGVWMRLKTPFHRFFFPITRHIYRHSDALVVYGTHVRDYLLSEGVREERIFLAPNSVDNHYYGKSVKSEEKKQLRSELSIPESGRIILFMGRLVPEKGLDVLLEAFRALDFNDAYLVLAGTGPLLQDLKEHARKLGITDHIRFPGHIAVDETPEYYSIADLVVLPSVTTPLFKEPWGLTLNEAMNQGVPVIASDAVGAAQGGLVQDGVNGLIVPEGDFRTLAEAMRMILGDDALHAAMAQSTRERVKTWNYEAMANGFIEALSYVGVLDQVKGEEEKV